jgi:predicted HTH transcriptional regulator
MFAKNVRKFVFHAETICVAFKDEKRIHIYDRRDVWDDLISQFNAAIEFFRKHLNVRSEIESIKQEEIYKIPLPAIREAVANALIHRNYAMTGTGWQMKLIIRLTNTTRNHFLLRFFQGILYLEKLFY